MKRHFPTFHRDPAGIVEEGVFHSSVVYSSEVRWCQLVCTATCPRQSGTAHAGYVALPGSHCCNTCHRATPTSGGRTLTDLCLSLGRRDGTWGAGNLFLKFPEIKLIGGGKRQVACVLPTRLWGHIKSPDGGVLPPPPLAGWLAYPLNNEGDHTSRVFPVAAVANDHTLGGLTQEKFTPSQPGGQTPQSL